MVFMMLFCLELKWLFYMVFVLVCLVGELLFVIVDLFKEFEMNILLLKVGLIIMLLIGVVVVLYVVFFVMDSGGNGSLDSYVIGYMSVFCMEEVLWFQLIVVYIGVDGQEICLFDYCGKVILVNFWVIWCVFCVEEMLVLSNLQSELGGDVFEVVMVFMDCCMEDVVIFFINMQLENLFLIYDSMFGLMVQIGVIGLFMFIFYVFDGCEIG